MSSETVVYYYADPAFRGEIAPILDDLRRRKHRVVKGDNADELLFLLQVGRPAAVIYTLAAADSATTAAYQMVSRRALDLLVPLILVGPDEPRDGVSLLFPEGKTVSRHHVPLHVVATLIERLAAAPPGTPSQPPEMIQQRTLGRGRSLLNWQAAATDVRQARPPDTSEIHAPPPGGAMPSRPAPLRPEPPTRPGDDAVEIEPAAPAEAAAAAEATGPGEGRDPRGRPRPSPLLPAAGLAVIAAIGAVLWFSTRPTAPPPQPVSKAAVGVPAAPAGDGTAEAAPSTPAPSAGEEEGEAEGGEVERPADIGRSSTPGPAAHPAGLEPGTTTPFPAHFRENTALFWFGDEGQRDGFLALVGALDPASTLRLTGHATESEAAEGRASLGTSRAWAVERWLTRQGFDPERITTERGPAVPDRGPLGDRGVPLNNWVTITIE